MTRAPGKKQKIFKKQVCFFILPIKQKKETKKQPGPNFVYTNQPILVLCNDNERKIKSKNGQIMEDNSRCFNFSKYSCTRLGAQELATTRYLNF